MSLGAQGEQEAGVGATEFRAQRPRIGGEAAKDVAGLDKNENAFNTV